MAKNQEYWHKRVELLEHERYGQAVKYTKDIEKAFMQTKETVEKDILKWYNRFADNNQITLDEARKLLNSNELKEFKWTVEDYIKYGKANAINGQWAKQLENASARVHISRLESLFVQMSNHVNVVYDKEIEGITALLGDTYKEQYAQIAFEVQKGYNVGFTVAAIDTRKLDIVLAKPWAVDGTNFSSRIYRDREKLIQVLQTELIQAVSLGTAPDKTIREVAKRVDVSYRDAARIVLTESAAISSRAQQDAFYELDVEKYEIVATLDSRTSQICQNFDGKVFELKDYKVGITAEPFHPNCRTTTAPYFEDDEDWGERIARDRDGNTFYVPGNMKYKEWKEKYLKEE